MTDCFTLADGPRALVEGTDLRFPVGRIFCIGRNYAAHAREMGNDEREAPFFFTKWAGALVPGGGVIAYPPQTTDFQFEAELVIAIGKPGAAIAQHAAPDHVFGYAAGLDMTRRDLQVEARQKGRPWDASKNFAQSAPLAPIRPATQAGHVTAAAIRLTLNGTLRQHGNVADMIWSGPEIIAVLSRFEPLLPGDLIFTGTPAGVGPVVPGDVIDVMIDGLQPLRVTIVPAEPAFA